MAAAPASPSGTNTYIPALGGEKKKELYEKEPEEMALSDDDLKQIVAAVSDLCDSKIQEATAPMLEALQALQPPLDPTAVDPAADPANPAAPGDPAMPGDPAPPDVPTDPAASNVPPVASPAPSTPNGDDPMPDPEKPEKKKPYAAGDERPSPDAPGENEKDKLMGKYRKERDELRVRYQKLEADHKTATAELTQLRGTTQKATRYAKCVELRDVGYVVDPDEELADTASHTDEQFEKHVEMIKRSYQRVPNRPLAREKPQDAPLSEQSEQSPEVLKRQRYSKKARELAQAEADKGNSLSFDAAFEIVSKSDAGAPAKEAIVA